MSTAALPRSTSTISQKAPACYNCSKSKRACVNDSIPCTECLRRNLTCKEPERKRSKRQASREPLLDPAPANGSDNRTDLNSDPPPFDTAHEGPNRRPSAPRKKHKGPRPVTAGSKESDPGSRSNPPADSDRSHADHATATRAPDTGNASSVGHEAGQRLVSDSHNKAVAEVQSSRKDLLAYGLVLDTIRRELRPSLRQPRGLSVRIDEVNLAVNDLFAMAQKKFASKCHRILQQLNNFHATEQRSLLFMLESVVARFLSDEQADQDTACLVVRCEYNSILRRLINVLQGDDDLGQRDWYSGLLAESLTKASQGHYCPTEACKQQMGVDRDMLLRDVDRLKLAFSHLIDRVPDRVADYLGSPDRASSVAHLAILRGHPAEAIRLVESGQCDPSQCDIFKRNMLHLLAQLNLREPIKLLWEKIPGIRSCLTKARDIYGLIPLGAAAVGGDRDTFEAVLCDSDDDATEELKTMDDGMRSILCVAASNSQTPIVDYVQTRVSAEEDQRISGENPQALYGAALAGSLRSVQSLIAGGVRPTQKMVDNYKRGTPLHDLHLEILRELQDALDVETTASDSRFQPAAKPPPPAMPVPTAKDAQQSREAVGKEVRQRQQRHAKTLSNTPGWVDTRPPASTITSSSPMSGDTYASMAPSSTGTGSNPAAGMYYAPNMSLNNFAPGMGYMVPQQAYPDPQMSQYNQLQMGEVNLSTFGIEDHHFQYQQHSLGGNGLTIPYEVESMGPQVASTSVPPYGDGAQQPGRKTTRPKKGTAAAPWN